MRKVCKPSTILQDATRLSGVALGETRALYPFIFKGFWGSPHHSRFISHRSNSSCFPAFHSLFGPYSPFLPALVRTSSDWVNPFRINGSSRKGRFRGLWEHALCPVLSPREFERLVRWPISPLGSESGFSYPPDSRGPPSVGNRRQGRGRRPAAASATRQRTGSES